MAKHTDPLELDRLAKALSKLRPIERDVLLLSAGEGLRNDEIAARLGISTEAAERLLADAVYHLDRNLDRLERPWWRFW